MWGISTCWGSAPHPTVCTRRSMCGLGVEGVKVGNTTAREELCEPIGLCLHLREVYPERLKLTPPLLHRPQSGR